MLASSKKGISTHQLHRALGVTYKTAWFMTHRIREAMREGTLAPMGGAGGSGVVEADETYLGKVANPQPSPNRRSPYTKTGKSGPSGKRADPPPLKWSALRYGFRAEEDRDAEEETQA
jgi:hypothetical protein